MTRDHQFQQNQKLWGVSQHLFVGVNTDLAVVYGKAGGASSLHYHGYKHNTFAVLRGRVEIIVSGLGSQVLGDHQSCVVPAGVAHRMHFLKDTVLHELYQAVDGHPIELGDIVRLDDGWEPPCDKPSD